MLSGVETKISASCKEQITGKQVYQFLLEFDKIYGKMTDLEKKEYQPKPKITYKMIQEYVEQKYGFKVHTVYIAEVKRSLGLTMYDAPNATEELKQPRKRPLKEKAEAIMEALKHFEVI